MNRFTDADKERMLGYPILSLLSIHGKRTDRHGALYFSPFREEKNRSMSIDIRRNVWYDHGEGRGGNVFTLAQRLLGIPDHRKAEVWDYLASLDRSIIPEQPPLPRQEERTSSIIIDSTSGDFPEYMYGYAASRGIRRSLLERYCRAVTYHVAGSNRSLRVIGFPAGSDGWVLRRATDREDIPGRKRCTRCTATFLGPDGEVTAERASDEVVVFEGFFDFLSWLEDSHLTLPQRDVCVLNSVSSTRSALPFLCSHGRIVTWLDNDRAGHEHTEAIRLAAQEAGCGFTDCSHHLGSSKDVNEYLMEKTRSAKSLKP